MDFAKQKMPSHVFVMNSVVEHVWRAYVCVCVWTNHRIDENLRGFECARSPLPKLSRQSIFTCDRVIYVTYVTCTGIFL